MKIAVTGVGGGVGQSILKSLKETDYQVIPLDADPLAAGLYYGKEIGHVIPYAKEERFISQLLDICKKEKISLLFPGMDAELMKLSVNREKFRETPTQLSFLSYDLVGLVYFLAKKNNFIMNSKIFSDKSSFKGKIGIFEIKNSKIEHLLNFYQIKDNTFKKIF